MYKNIFKLRDFYDCYPLIVLKGRGYASKVVVDFSVVPIFAFNAYRVF